MLANTSIRVLYRYLPILTLLAAFALCAAEDELPIAEAQTIIKQRVDDGWNYGIAAGLIDAHGSHVVSYGKLSAASEQKIDGDTVFEIGSLTKTFTSILLADMALHGEVALTDPVSKFLPAGATMPEKDGKQIALLNLAQHTSGLPRLPGNMNPKDRSDPYADYSVELMYAFLKGYALPRGIGEKYEYSNLGVGLLGHVLALKSGGTYEALVTSRLCAPLGMNDTRIVLTPELQARLAIGHGMGGKEVHGWNFVAVAGCGALRSTVNDLLKYVAANMGLTETKLSPAMLETQTHRFRINKDMELGLGWHIAQRFGHEIVWHNGGTGGYRSFAGFVKDTHIGAVVLTNTECSVDDIGMHLLEKKCALDMALSIKRKEHKEVPVDPKIFAAYVGVYELMPGITFTITQEGTRLMSQATKEPKLELFPESETEFFFKAVEAEIVFMKNSAGEVTHFVLKRSGLKFDAKKKK